jgi:hypothetical protein
MTFMHLLLSTLAVNLMLGVCSIMQFHIYYKFVTLFADCLCQFEINLSFLHVINHHHHINISLYSC